MANFFYYLFFMLLGAALLWVIQWSANYARSEFRRRNVLRRLAFVGNTADSSPVVVDLINGDPEIRLENIVCREQICGNGPCCLYIDAPTETKELLASREREAGYEEGQVTKFHADTSFDGSCDYDDLADMTGIPDLPILIERHRRLVGQLFLNPGARLIFNGEKYGVGSLSFPRFGPRELAGVRGEFFRTDYFTHLVFRSIYRELQQRGHEIATVTGSNLLRYAPFLTSVGVNALLFCQGSSGKHMVLVKRSGRVAGSEGGLYHVTMNEGVTSMDKRLETGEVDLGLTLQRGFREELGITENIYRSASHIAYYDVFLERSAFALGLSAAVCLEMDARELAKLPAKDKAVEFDHLVILPLRKDIIGDFVRRNAFIPHGRYVLDQVLLREDLWDY